MKIQHLASYKRPCTFQLYEQRYKSQFGTELAENATARIYCVSRTDTHCHVIINIESLY
jgi:hypothetical protein